MACLYCSIEQPLRFPRVAVTSPRPLGKCVTLRMHDPLDLVYQRLKGVAHLFKVSMANRRSRHRCLPTATQAALTSTPSPGSGGEPDLRSTLNTGSLHRRLQFWRRCEGSGLVGGTEVVGDGHVVRVVDGRIDSLADHAQLPPCGVEGVVNFTPGRVVGHLVSDENANAHVRITSYRLYVAKAFSMSLSVVGFKICTDLAGARAGHVLTTSVMRR